MNAFEQSPLFQRFAVLLITFFCAVAAQAALATEDAQCKQMAQGYPSRNVTLVVGFPPGGQTDQIGRIVAEALSVRLNHPVVVDNRGGLVEPSALHTWRARRPMGMRCS